MTGEAIGSAPRVCVLFEGWDASGKGGVIKRLVAPRDPRHVRVAQFAAPTPDEKRSGGSIQDPGEGPLKRWNLTDEDWRNREKRGAYVQAAEDMFGRTDHQLARLQLVEADSKRYARVKVLETVIREIEHGMREAGLEPPAIAAVKG